VVRLTSPASNSRAAQGKPVKHVASVASFFVSRIDALVDPLLDKLIAQDGKKVDFAKKALGQVAISSAKAAYQIYKEIFDRGRFKKLVSQGARAQRLLWASTSTKNPDYSDVKYVEALIGPDTVNTAPLEPLMPTATMEIRKPGSNKTSWKPTGAGATV